VRLLQPALGRALAVLGAGQALGEGPQVFAKPVLPEVELLPDALQGRLRLSEVHAELLAVRALVVLQPRLGTLQLEPQRCLALREVRAGAPRGFGNGQRPATVLAHGFRGRQLLIRLLQAIHLVADPAHQALQGLLPLDAVGSLDLHLELQMLAQRAGGLRDLLANGGLDPGNLLEKVFLPPAPLALDLLLHRRARAANRAAAR